MSERTPQQRVAAAESALRMMLYTHAVAGLAVAAALLLGGGALRVPAFDRLAALPGWPWAWALVLAVSAAGILAGKATGGPRVVRVALYGMVVWHVSFAAGLAAGGAVYLMVVFGLLAALCTVHLAVEGAR